MSQAGTPPGAPAQKDHGRAGRDLPASIASAIVLLAAIALSRDVPEFWLSRGDVQVGMAADRRNVAALENIFTGERYPGVWGGIRLRLDPVRDPALLFSCLA